MHVVESGKCYKIVRSISVSGWIETKTHLDPRVAMDTLGILARMTGSTNSGFPVARFFTGLICKVAAT